MVEYQQVGAATTFLALGHPVRCEMVDRLSAGEQRVTDLARAHPISLAAVSKHIQVLERAGIVRRRVDGRTHWIALDPRPISEARTWLDGTERFWAGRLDRLAATLEAERDSAARGGADRAGRRSATQRHSA